MNARNIKLVNTMQHATTTMVGIRVHVYMAGEAKIVQQILMNARYFILAKTMRHAATAMVDTRVHVRMAGKEITVH
jgi:hypothetical protein